MQTYIDYTAAMQYCEESLGHDSWLAASESDRYKALASATRLIEALPLVGMPATRAQELHFPIAGDEGIPVELGYACLEIADALLGGRNPETEFEMQNVTSTTFGRVSESRNANIRLPHIEAGIPSLAAWKLIRPWLRTDLQAINLKRVD